MPSRSSKKPKKDFSQVAFDVVSRLTAGRPSTDSKEGVSKALDDEELRKQVMREMGRRGGKKGGKARAENLTADQRAEIASKAAKSRWRKNSS